MKLCPKCQKQFSDDANFCPVDAARLVPLAQASEGTEGHPTSADPIAARFELGDRLGGSRTGAVYGAADKTTGHVVALKIVAPAVVALPGLAPRLERELKQLERVQSAGVARVVASGKRGDDHWVAIELLDGAQTLAEAIAARGPIAIEGAAQLIEVIGEALIEAAQVGVVHRDLAPKNILFAGADVKLINFSLPVPTGDKVPGVPEFVAPEQYDGKPVDQRSNLYSLGALYYFVLTGQTVQLDEAGAVKPPSSLAPIPPPVDAVILRALDRSPTKRYLTVRQFIDEVGRVARGEPEKSTQPIARVARGKGELVQTLLGRPPGLTPPAAPAPSVHGSSAGSSAASTVAPAAAPAAASTAAPAAAPAAVAVSGTLVGVGSAGVAAPSTLVDKSPWSPPVATASQLANPEVSDPVMAAQVVSVPIAATPSAPVVPPPLLAGALLGSAGKKANAGGDPKSQFRDTLWFKKGELDAEAAAAAAEEHARTGKLAQDRSDLLPLDERYKDDGSVSRSDKERYSLRTGATEASTALRDSAAVTAVDKVSEAALIGEMKRGRNRVVLLIAIGLAIAALIVFLIVR
ncbi:MAG TPA: serine/threonine-protein kinase [Kofleriaceae bacterium]|nr:serine/threonine-protein kinase [Kofleriaceae bacterium]